MAPYLDETLYVGALHVPGKLIVSGADVASAIIRDTEAMGGVAFVGQTEVIDIEVKGGRVAAVHTNNPDMATVACEQVVLCTNIWSPILAGKLGIHVPLLAAEHQFVRSTPIPNLSQFDPNNKDDEIVYPTVRDLDVAMYFRQYWHTMGIGSYHHKPLMHHPRTVGKSATMPFTPDDFHEAWGIVQQAIPDLKSAEIIHSFNGMFSFSIDGSPVVGETVIKGFWVAAAIWLTHAGGVGKVMAELLTHGASEWDIRQIDVNRFLDYQITEKFISIAASKNYAEVYDLTHPAQPTTRPRNVRLTPFHAFYQSMKATFIPNAGLEMPYWFGENQRLLEQYEDRVPERSGWGAKYWSRIQGAEHLATRENMALFDLTSLAIIEVVGKSAADYLNYLCTGEMDMAIGRMSYTLMCTPGGGIKRDLTVARVAEDCYWMFTGNATLPLELQWIRQHAPTDGSVTIRDLSHTYAALGLWGPNARTVLERVTHEDVSNEGFPFYTCRWLEVGMVKAFALRLSYVGELGWELHLPMDMAAAVWQDLWEAGRDLGIVAAGAGAFRSLRFEKGYRLWGSDIHTEYNPYEAGMGWMVRLNKGEFIGRSALTKAKNAPLKRRLCTLTVDNPNVVLTGYEPIYSNGDCIGQITSGNYGYAVGKYIAFGYVPVDYAEPGTVLQVEYLAERHRAVVTQDVLWDPQNERMKV
jgi:glycine cleavage system T protein